jgi:hypothetical protein
MQNPGKRRELNTELLGKPEGKRYLGKPRRIKEDKIEKDLRETGWDDQQRIGLFPDKDRFL